ncbi:C4-dicarboxylate TRAP transporter substrate-binding protein [Rhizobium wenxiniae]|uniref:C4-dicarboxylate TRAP transporter substrate-binding protein n=1 Tax=Rhizobium wenxiniae TaxID=1737357 RepID=UPI001C6DF767|nr:C4-dicarboxylate TRAP transporter substrate-binding protein [Rhizobium wenxiniae]MBW9087354.1 C4-dicarboxylate TRAP transporter substrate-binding protein [Rhizobium wenxiniae]
MGFLTRAVRATVFSVSFTALMAGGALAADYTLNVNTALTSTDPLYKGLEDLQKNVAERSGGKLAIRLFPGSQLGKDEDVLEQARAGAANAVVVDGGRLAVFVKEFGVLSGPYLASGYDGIRKVVTSPLMDKWSVDLRKKAQLQVLSFNWWQGERHLFTNKPIKTPADLSGIRMRTPGAAVWTETVRAMGATPAPMAWADVYSALQTQVIDAVEAQDPAGYGSRLYEVTNQLTKTGHFNLITGLITSAAWFDSLPQDMQTILKEEALKAGDIASHGTEASLADLEKKMAEAGMTVSEIDVTPFKEATAGVYEKLGYADLKKEVDAILAQ